MATNGEVTSRVHDSGIVVQPLYTTDKETEAQSEAGSCLRSSRVRVLRELDPEFLTPHL